MPDVQSFGINQASTSADPAFSSAPAAARKQECLLEPGRSSVQPYLRAAQAYMLISMPTGTSTIFGVFQVILASHGYWRAGCANAKVKPARI